MLQYLFTGLIMKDIVSAERGRTHGAAASNKRVVVHLPTEMSAYVIFI